ncbi:MAG: hypothetical protein KC503_36430 [Myxococcales bacterium]|nr:hypothetical protein [Myxococcales bacterium]
MSGRAARRALVLPLLLLAVSLVAGPGCVRRVDLDRTPCPCGDDFVCCETLRSCLRAGDEASCPASYPPSTGSACTRDSDCDPAEACHSWTVGGSDEVVGPRQCRRLCEPTRACADGEVCELAPHDGRALDAFFTAGLCVAGSARDDGDATTGPSDGGDAGGGGECGPWSCQGCPTDRVGQPFCDGTDLYGCLVSAHPTCGLKCERVLLKRCTECAVSGGVINCSENSIRPQKPCEDLPCSACPSAAAGTTFCTGSQVSTCLRMPFAECGEICVPSALRECGASGCSQPSGSAASCGP